MAWQMRRDTAANWTSEDPVLAQGEPGFDTTNNEIRIGDGTSTWSNLDPISGDGGDVPSPHDLGGSHHGSDTLANLNTKVSDATLDDSSDPRDPTSHATDHEPGGDDAMAVDAAAGTGSLRTLGTGGTQAAAGDHDHDSDYATTGHDHTESEITDLGVYPDADGQPSGKVAETDGADGWTFIDTPSGGGSGTDDHGDLTGLGDDDHTQYLRADGTRALTGDQDAGGNKLTGLADGTADDDAATVGQVDNATGAPQVAVDDAIFTWWNDPNRAQTFRGHIYTGGVENSGDIVVESTSPEDDRMVLGSFEDDDHNNPALLIEPDHGPLVFYQRHRMDSVLRYRLGTDPGDLTTLGAEQTLTTSDVCTYSQLWRRPGTDTVWVLTRVKTFSDPVTWEVFRSDDYGDTWGSAQSLLGPEQYVYVGSTQVGSTVRCAVAKHPDADSPDVWYFEIDLDDGAITDRDGTVIGNLDGTNLPLDTSDLESVYTAPSSHGMRLLACSDRADPDGGPALAVATWTTDTDTVYRHVDYDDGAWASSEICPAGEVFGFTPSKHYNGGVAFPDRTLGGELLVSREDGGTWHIERWVQQGSSWIFAETYQTSDTDLLFRPWPSRGGGFVFCRAATYSSTGTRGTGLSILAVEPDLGIELGDSGTSNRAAREDHDHDGLADGFDPDEPLDYFTIRDGDGIDWTVTIETDGTLTTTSTVVAYDDEVAADSPFTYWRLEETSGTTATDEQENHDGTHVNSPTLGATGAVDNAVTYNGSDQRTDISTLGTFGSNMASGTTIEFWAKWSHTDANQSICGVLEDGTSTAVEVAANGAGQFGNDSGIGRLSATVRETVGVYRSRTTARSDLNDGDWHHFAIVFDGDDLDIYVDGTLDNGTTDDAGTAPIEPGDFTYDWMWGCRNLRDSASKHFDGSLDELALYQSALSAARIQAHYDAA